jgi:hypothetical protein
MFQACLVLKRLDYLLHDYFERQDQNADIHGMDLGIITWLPSDGNTT